MRKMKYVACAVAILHNYCINERLEDAAGGRNVDPVVESNTNNRGRENFVSQAVAELEAVSNFFNGWSVNCEQMVLHIENLGLERIQLSK